jgi:hypothetical protein
MRKRLFKAMKRAVCFVAACFLVVALFVVGVIHAARFGLLGVLGVSFVVCVAVITAAEYFTNDL